MNDPLVVKEGVVVSAIFYLPPVCRMMKMINAATSKMVICVPGRIMGRRRYSGSRRRRRSLYLLYMAASLEVRMTGWHFRDHGTL